jgi:hypothetical protein
MHRPKFNPANRECLACLERQTASVAPGRRVWIPHHRVFLRSKPGKVIGTTRHQTEPCLGEFSLSEGKSDKTETRRSRKGRVNYRSRVREDKASRSGTWVIQSSGDEGEVLYVDLPSEYRGQDI